MARDGTRRDRLAVRVRRAVADDAAALAAVHAGMAVVAGTMQVPYPTEALWRQRLEDNPSTIHGLLAQTMPDQDPADEVVGMIALIVNDRPRLRHVARLGMAVRDDIQGRGVGGVLLDAAIDLAERWLEVRRIALDVYPDNEVAVGLYESRGFVHEGRARLAVFRDGEYRDLLQMARLAPGFGEASG